MAEDQLFAHAVAHVVHRKAPGGAFDVRVEHDLEQHVAQLFAHERRVVPVKALAGFIRLLQKVPADGLVRLHAIPRAAARGAQQRDEPDEIVKAISRFPCKI